MRHAVAVVFVLIFAAGAVSAATFAPVTDSQLTDRAQLVVVGHVLDTASRVRADGVIVTDSRIAVEDVLKGQAGATITVTEIGGSANGLLMLIPGSAQYTPGARVVAFLKQRPDGSYFTSSMSLGLYRFKAQRDRVEVLVREDDGVEIDGGEGNTFAPRIADSFVKFVRDHAQGRATAEAETAAIAPRVTADAVIEPNAASDYVLTGGSPARPIRWKNCEAGCTINYKVNNSQPGPTDVPGGIDHAMAAWTNHVDSFVTMNLTGLSGVTNVANFDSENTIVLDNPTTSSPNVGQCDSSLGCGIVWANDGTCTATNCHTFHGIQFYTALQGDVIIRPNTLSQNFFEALVAHELGHSIALKHGPTGNLMSASIPSNATATLKTWDKEAMAVVYGAGLPCQAPAVSGTSGGGNVTAGGTKTLSVNATGTAPLSYQWYEGSSGNTAVPVGTNSSSYTTPPITQTRSFWVRVTNACGTADSNTITVTPNAGCTAPAITTQPASQTITAGGTATLNVEATGTATLSYLWYEGAVNDTTKFVAGTKSFTTPALNATTSYWVKVNNSCGNAVSNLATITVTQQCVPAAITSQPTNPEVALGQGVTLVIATSGNAPITFQWYQGPSPDTTLPIEGATTNSFATPTFTSPGDYRYWVKVSNACATVNSATITVHVACPDLALPVISAPPASPGTTGYEVTWGGNTDSLVSAYEVEEATNRDFTANVKTFLVTGESNLHINAHSEITADTRFFYRVRAVNACNHVKTEFSVPTSTLVTAKLPQNSAEFSVSVPDGVKDKFTQNYLVPGFGNTATNVDTFSITTDVPWLTVFPSSGALSAGGTTVQLTYDTTGLDVGTTTGTVVVNRTNGAASHIGTNGTTPVISVPVSVSLVTPVTPVPRDATAPPGTLIIPAIAHADGIGTRFQSDVRIANTSGEPITYELSFTPSGTNGTQTGKKTTLVVPAHDTKGLDDIVKAWYGSGVLGESGLGTLEIRPLGEVNAQSTFASSRTYAISSAGTLGQFIPAIPLSQFVGDIAQNPLAKLSLQQIANSTAYRTNFGFVEGGGQPVDLAIKLLDGNNNVLQQITKTLQPFEHQQMGFTAANMFGASAPQITDGRVEVSVTSPGGKVTAYASVVDNKTSDPLLVFPVQAAAVTAQRYVAPGIAELNNGASNFHSDMRIYNGGNASVDVALKYYEQGATSPNPKTVTRSIDSGKVLAIDNVLPELWGLAASGGAVTVDAPPTSSLVVTARTYSRDSAGGTFGQFIPGVTAREAVGFGERSLELLQLEESASYRTNLGLVEVTGNPVTIEISAYKPDTKLTVVTTVGLKANEFRQLGFVFRSMGLPTVYNGRISVKVIEGEGRVASYGSVVDNRTVDPTYVPAQ